MNNSYKSNSSVMSSSNVVESSSSVRATSAHSNSASSAENTKPEATPREVRPLRERTSIKDTNDNTRYLKITEKNGDVVTAYLSKPSYQFAQDVDDDRFGTIPFNHHVMQVPTTTRYEKKLFKIFRNVEINGKPTSGMNFDLPNEGHVEAFSWMIQQANSFLRDKFVAD